MRIPVRLQEYLLPILFTMVGLSMCTFLGTPPASLLNELISRITLHGILVLALLPPLQAGMGFNFATGLGAWAARAGFLVAAAYGLSGATGSGLALIAGLVFAAALGAAIGWLLSRMPGMEMLVTLFLLIPVSMFPLLMITKGLRAILPAPLPNPATGFVSDSVDLEPFNHSLTFAIQVGPVSVPLGPMVLLAMAGFAVHAFLRSKYARHAAETSDKTSASVGKVLAFSLSLMLASLSYAIVLQGRPFASLHPLPALTRIPIIPALIAGGALLHRAGLRHAFLGMIALNLVYIPLPGLLDETSEFIKVILSNGLILYALTRPDPSGEAAGIAGILPAGLLSGSRTRP